MKRLLILLLILTAVNIATAENTTEAPVPGGFVDEETMKDDLMQMLANFAVYMKNGFQDCVEPNSDGEACGCFKGENTMGNDERGVRPNADLSMICAFLVKYCNTRVVLPQGVTWKDLEQMAMKSLVFAYSTHKANRLKVCKGGNYWGSLSENDHAWESSLWAMSVAYSAFFQWEKLSDQQKGYIYELLKAECNYELERSIPTGYDGDTKAEENGWEADVLAATLGLFPNDALAPQWFQRLREFAINSYSQKDDATDATIIDPDYDTTAVKDLYRGQNLYDDFTLQNHNYFHTSYQNVVIQELGEAALALKLFQQELYGTEKWKTNALMHNNDRVMHEVLYWLALSDGELAMPNGNDWSLFLYDQITSYSTNACFLRDPHALMLENLAYRMIKARQATTTDGSWLLRPDVGARRMGVEAHRVMMTWLMHHVLPTQHPSPSPHHPSPNTHHPSPNTHHPAPITPTSWSDFNHQFECAKVFPSQNIIRASSDDRFTCFSWSTGLKSYTGYISPHASTLDPQGSNLIVPFRANNTGNFLGWYEVQGKKTNATPVNLQSSISNLQLKDNAWVMNGELLTNDNTLNNRFAIYSTPGNAVIYIDYVRARTPCIVTAEKGGLMAISVDELTKTERTLFTADGEKQLDGTTLTTMNGPWVNIDNVFGIATFSADNIYKKMAFGERANNNSVMTAKLYALYDDTSRSYQQNDVVDRRTMAYYSNTTAEATRTLFQGGMQLQTPEGWNGIIAADPDSTRYMLLSNFAGNRECTLRGVSTSLGAPVFDVETSISKAGSTATFTADENHSVANTLKFFIAGEGVTAVQAHDDPATIYVHNDKKGKNTVTVTFVNRGRSMSKKVKLSAKTLKIFGKPELDFVIQAE